MLDAVAAALLVAIAIVLLAGVVARYAFRAPLIWSDEVSSSMFLWLAMLGAIALREVIGWRGCDIRRAKAMDHVWGYTIVNDVTGRRSTADTPDLIFDIPSLVETLSPGMMLHPGDVIATGTSVCVLGFELRRFLEPGDEVTVTTKINI